MLPFYDCSRTSPLKIKARYGYAISTTKHSSVSLVCGNDSEHSSSRKSLWQMSVIHWHQMREVDKIISVTKTAILARFGCLRDKMWTLDACALSYFPSGSPSFSLAVDPMGGFSICSNCS